MYFQLVSKLLDRLGIQKENACILSTLWCRYEFLQICFKPLIVTIFDYLQTLFMMLGESMCMVVYVINKYIVHRADPAAVDGDALDMNPLVLWPVSTQIGIHHLQTEIYGSLFIIIIFPWFDNYLYHFPIYGHLSAFAKMLY